MWDVSAWCHWCSAASLGRVRTVGASRCWESELGGLDAGDAVWEWWWPMSCCMVQGYPVPAAPCPGLTPLQATRVLGETPHRVWLRPDLMEDAGLCHHHGEPPGGLGLSTHLVGNSWNSSHVWWWGRGGRCCWDTGALLPSTHPEHGSPGGVSSFPAAQGITGNRKGQPLL